MITYRDGRPVLHGHDLQSLMETYGSPLYVYSAHSIDQACRELLEVLRPHAYLLYSVKANANPHLIARLAGHGVGVEAASAGEIFVALAAGVSPDRIHFGGPGKTEEEIAFAIAQQIFAFHVESVREAERINRVAAEAGRVQDVLLRVNLNLSTVRARIRMGGAARQFGIDEEKLPEVITEIRKLPYVRLVGLFAYMGTQILDVDSIVLTTDYLLRLATSLAQSHKIPLKVIDFGGGFGIPYFTYELPLDLSELHDRLEECFSRWKNRFPVLEETRFVFESGRFLLARAGYYLTRVVDIKESRGKIFVITDGGMNHIASSAGIGRVMREEVPLWLLRPDAGEPPLRTFTVVGPTCTPVDVLHSALQARQVDVGDIVAIPNAGAYSLTMSPVYFCGHPTPCELLLEEGRITVIRRRGTLEELLWNINP